MSELRSKVLTAIQTAGVGVVVLILASFGIGTGLSPPPNAIMFVDEGEGRYYSPPCVEVIRGDASGLHEATDAEIKRLWDEETASGQPRRLWPSEECANELNGVDEAGGFNQEGRSLGGKFLERIGLFAPLRSRWNPDGTWRW